MTAACNLSKEKLVGLEEGLVHPPIEINVKKRKNSLCKTLVQYTSIILYVELIILGHWALYNLWCNYNYGTYVSETKASDVPSPAQALPQYQLQQQQALADRLNTLEKTLDDPGDSFKTQFDVDKDTSDSEEGPMPQPIPSELPATLGDVATASKHSSDLDPRCLVNNIVLTDSSEILDPCFKKPVALRNSAIVVDDDSGHSYLCYLKYFGKVPVLECVLTIRTGGPLVTDQSTSSQENQGERVNFEPSLPIPTAPPASSHEVEDPMDSDELRYHFLAPSEPRSETEPFFPTDSTWKVTKESFVSNSGSDSGSTEFGGVSDLDRLAEKPLWKEEDLSDPFVLNDLFEIPGRFIRSIGDRNSFGDTSKKSE